MGLALLLALGFLVFWAFLVWSTVRALCWPRRRTYAWCLANSQPDSPGALSPPREFESTAVENPSHDSGELPVWRIPGDLPTGPVVIFSHGWAEARQAVLQRLDALLPVCREVIAWDMPGHGDSPPGRVRLGASEHVELGKLMAVARGVDAHGEERGGSLPIVLYGFSLGAGVGIRAAAEAGDRVAGVIAEAPYRLPQTPARAVMRSMAFPHRLNLRPALVLVGLVSGCGPRWRGFDRAQVARAVSCPLVVLHGAADAISPVADGRAIAEAAPLGRFAEIDRAGHLDMWREDETRDEATKVLRGFLRRLGDRASARQ